MWPQTQLFHIELITAESHDRRGVGFLIGEHRSINAKYVFDSMAINAEQIFRARFDYWIDGAYGSVYKKYFHGWKEPEYRECFVFKYQKDRLYGFLCNPRNDPRWQLCVLVAHASKTEFETDDEDLNKVNSIKNHVLTQKALAEFKRRYP
jgi:hypothetical protein